MNDDETKRAAGLSAADDEMKRAAGLPAADDETDALGLLCPLPVLRARKRLAALAPGQVLALLADDPAAAVDVPHFCAEQGHAMLDAQALPGGGRRWLIRKGG